MIKSKCFVGNVYSMLDKKVFIETRTVRYDLKVSGFSVETTERGEHVPNNGQSS